MFPVFGTTSKYPFSTFHLAVLPSALSHCSRPVPSNRTMASEGGLPGTSGVLEVPGVTMAGTGRSGSWIFQRVSTCAWAGAPQSASKARAPKFLFMEGPSPGRGRDFSIFGLQRLAAALQKDALLRSINRSVGGGALDAHAEERTVDEEERNDEEAG